MAGLSGNILEQTNVGGTDYNFRDLDRGCEFIYGTQTATTGAWTGVTTDTELVDGKQILYFLPFAGSGNATLNLTLADGTTTGAKNVYFQSTTRMTTHYGQYTQFRLIYHANHKIGNTYYEGWWSEPGRDTTTTNATQIQFNSNALKAGSSALTAGNIIVANNDGLYKHLKTGTAFDITWPIVYLAENVAATKATNNVYTEINFTVATTQSITLTAQKPVFIKGTLSGTTFTPISTTPLTQTIPSSADGYHYMYLGYGYATTAIRLQPYHPIFAYINGAFNLYTGVSSYASSAGNAATVNNHTVAKDVPSDAKFTYHEYSGTGLISVSNAGVISTTATANTGTITSVKTTAGTHSTINVTSGAANFNVPTKTSHLTNDSGFVTTDTNTTYSLSAGTGDDANKIVLTPSTGTANKVTVPYATNAGTVNSLTVETAVPANAVFTDTNDKVNQVLDTSNANRPIAICYGNISNTDTNSIHQLYRNNNFYVNPSTGTVTATNFNGKINNHTVNEDVPSGANFTDYQVTQVLKSSDNINLPLLLSAADNTNTTLNYHGMTCRNNTIFANPVHYNMFSHNICGLTFSGGLTTTGNDCKVVSMALKFRANAGYTGIIFSRGGLAVFFLKMPSTYSTSGATFSSNILVGSMTIQCSGGSDSSMGNSYFVSVTSNTSNDYIRFLWTSSSQGSNRYAETVYRAYANGSSTDTLDASKRWT